MSITTRGTISPTPDCGIQEYFPERKISHAWIMPMPIPATTVGTRYWNSPTIAAARAGTTNRVYVSGVTGDSGAMRMPAAPATAPASIQFRNAIRSGETPLT